ncbi:atherin-like [Anser cygnoides]|uniref:atherin-like n=1 Tax=Anser cygnoides TaxID=8845 RepID=UPI0034D31F48
MGKREGGRCPRVAHLRRTATCALTAAPPPLRGEGRARPRGTAVRPRGSTGIRDNSEGFKRKKKKRERERAENSPPPSPPCAVQWLAAAQKRCRGRRREASPRRDRGKAPRLLPLRRGGKLKRKGRGKGLQRRGQEGALPAAVPASCRAPRSGRWKADTAPGPVPLRLPACQAPCLPPRRPALPPAAAHLPTAARRVAEPRPAPAASGAAGPAAAAPARGGSGHHVTFSPANAYRRLQGPPRKEAAAAAGAGERARGSPGAAAAARGRPSPEPRAPSPRARPPPARASQGGGRGALSQPAARSPGRAQGAWEESSHAGVFLWGWFPRPQPAFLTR